MIIHMRHTLWTGISETNVNVITSATRTHALIIIIITITQFLPNKITKHPKILAVLGGDTFYVERMSLF